MEKLSHWQEIPGGVAAPRSFWASGVKAGIKNSDKYDVALIASEVEAEAAGVFTRNVVKAHPLLLTQKHLANGRARAIVANSGNANACVGAAGDQAALGMARGAAEGLGFTVDEVLVASTGVIGVELPLGPVQTGIGQAAAELKVLIQASAHGSAQGIAAEAKRLEAAHRAALAIMTTDTTVKEFAWEMECRAGTIRLGAMAKGSGMIHPNMGTMLGFITTDAEVPAAELQRLLREAVDESFNMVTVDGDTSTNDMVLFLANGASRINPVGEEWERFEQMVKAMAVHLAREIARDGEGAGKLLEVKVTGAKTKEDARKIARSICGSSLVKTAMFGADANWGRILCAAGYSGANFNPGKVDISLGNLPVALAGQGVSFSEDEAKLILQKDEISISLHLHNGLEEATAWGCDLTYEYVRINGDYRT